MNYYSTPAQDVLSSLQVEPTKGLTKTQIEESIVLHGTNSLPEQKEPSLLYKIFRQLINPLVAILIGAAILTLFLHEYVDTLVITIAVLVNVVVALIQEGKASEAYKLLQQKRVHKTVVIRDGKKQEIDLHELVVGDIVQLYAGLYVPADIRVLEATNLSANQVVFTGESIAVSKDEQVFTQEEGGNAFEQSSMVFTGTTIGSGLGLGVVTAVGVDTEFAKIAQSLSQVEKEKSPIEKQSENIARAISIVAGVIIVLILALGIYRGLPFYELILLAIAIAVSAVPEGLPSAITAILAYGASLIGKEGGLVKNLSSAQTLGSTDVILTDKTGTLTYGDMQVSRVVTLNDTDHAQEMTLTHGLYATDVFYDSTHAHFVGDDVDQALGKYYPEGGEYVQRLIDATEVLSTVPFDSRNKLYAAVREMDGKKALYTKGAFEILWDRSTHVLEHDQIRKKTEQDYKFYAELVEHASSEGKRLLAVAHKDTQKTDSNLDDVSGLIFCGLLVMEDKVRTTAADSVYQAQEAGVAVIMITGDAPVTARTIALETGIISDPTSKVLLGEEMSHYSDDELFTMMDSGELLVFSRVSPEHKLRLVDIFTEKGKTVAMTGDGVNDSLALSRAAIGISLSSATDVAKEASDLILTDNSFSGIIFALKEGRRIASNITKTIIYLVSTSFSEVLVIAAALVFALPVPFLPSHILWANILEEGLMNFAFLFEPNRSPQNKPRRIINKQVIQAIISISILNSVLFVGLYGGLYMFTDTTLEMKRTIMFGALAVSALFLSWSVRSISMPFWKIDISSNKFFIVAMLINIVLFALTIGTEVGRTVMHLEPLTMLGMLGLLGFGILNVLSVEFTKWAFWKSKEPVLVAQQN